MLSIKRIGISRRSVFSRANTFPQEMLIDYVGMYQRGQSKTNGK
jgi:hypothetical protein